MKKIDGIDLAKLIAAEENEYFAERQAEVMRIIRGIMANRRAWSFRMAQLAQESEKLQDKIQKADAQIARISNGDWSALPDAPKDKKDTDAN
jgi:hypothetical protein